MTDETARNYVIFTYMVVFVAERVRVVDKIDGRLSCKGIKPLCFHVFYTLETGLRKSMGFKGFFLKKVVTLYAH